MSLKKNWFLFFKMIHFIILVQVLKFNVCHLIVMKNMKIINQFMVVMTIVLLLLTSCKKANLAILTTTEISESGLVSAVSGGNISSDGGAGIIARGVCWSENENPTISDNKTTDGTGPGTFKSEMTGLKEGTKYYVKAYATNSEGTAYGNTVWFKTFNIKDADGNGYHSVQIGNQVWMAENLKVTHFQNGDRILDASSDSQWSTATGSAFCYYKNLTSNASTYGALYNFYAAADSRNVCPVGWHVPSIDEWITLFRLYGSEFTADVRLREAGTDHWIKDTGADNSSGFSMLPGGNRESDGTYFNLTTRANVWSSTEWIENDVTAGWLIGMEWDQSLIRSTPYGKTYGASIRCIKN
jgi:uncharacterized protein (TIGR02145 family)